MKKSIMIFAIALTMAALAAMTACKSGNANDTLVADTMIAETASTPVATQTLVIDVETLTPPKKLLETISYDKILANLLKDLNKDSSVVIAHTRKTHPAHERGRFSARKCPPLTSAVDFRSESALRS